MKTSNPSPPKYILRLLQWACPRPLHEGIEGDLLEQFEENCRRFGIRTARRKFYVHAISFLRPGILLRNKITIHVNQLMMLTSYFKIMSRLFMKRKAQSAISVFGLTAGITFSLLIGVFIHKELQVNKDIGDIDRLFLVETKTDNDTAFPFFAPSPLVKVSADEYPALVDNYYRFWDRMITVSKDDKHFRIQSMIGDSTFFQMFGFTPLYGNPQTALLHVNSIVITEEIARLYFDRTDVVGESLTLSTERNGGKDFLVTAVLPDLGRNVITDFMNMNARIFLPLDNASDFSLGDPDVWDGSQIISYLKLRPAVEKEDIPNVLNKIAVAHIPDSIRKNSIYTTTALDNYYLEANNGAVKKMLGTLSVIAIFILGLAVINYINMTIGNSVLRLKEIGVRKVIGGIRGQIVFQFMAESMALAVIAGVLSLAGYFFLHPLFGNIFKTELPPISGVSLDFWMWFLVFVLGIGAMAGVYPSIFLSSYKTLDSLKGKFRIGSGMAFSKVLVTAQFAVASFVFICAIVLTRQVSYFTEKDLGYDHSFVMTVSSVPRLWSQQGLAQMEAAKSRFLHSPRIESVSLSWEIPSGNYADVANVYPLAMNPENAVQMPLLRVDEHFASVYGIDVREGEFFFGQEGRWQPQMVVLNESAQKVLGVSVGDKVKFNGTGPIEFKVMGVVNDFNFFSLHTPMKPLILLHTNESQIFRHLSFKVQGDNLSASVSEIKTIWKQVFPNDPCDFAFMDETLASLYKRELQLKNASNVATVLMLIILFTGILGLVSLMVSQRTKEIGIRKVLGATVVRILVMLISEYARLIFLAFVMVIPAAWYIARAWLSGFAYHIDLSWWMFYVPVFSMVVVTVAIVTAQSWKTSMSNPARTLKYE